MSSQHRLLLYLPQETTKIVVLRLSGALTCVYPLFALSILFRCYNNKNNIWIMTSLLVIKGTHLIQSDIIHANMFFFRVLKWHLAATVPTKQYTLSLVHYDVPHFLWPTVTTSHERKSPIHSEFISNTLYYFCLLRMNHNKLLHDIAKSNMITLMKAIILLFYCEAKNMTL